MIKAEPHIVGKLSDGVVVVEIVCPVCDSKQVDFLEEDNCYECDLCGIKFVQDYEFAGHFEIYGED